LTGAVSAYFTDSMLPTYIVKTILLTTGSAPLTGVFTDNPVPNLVNLSLWTLKYEVLCYGLLALFGLAYVHFPRLRSALTFAVACVVAGIFVGAPKPISGYTTADNLRYFVLFFSTGTLAYLMRDRLVLTWLALPVLFGIFVLAIGSRFGELTSALFLGYGTLLVASLSWPKIRHFTNRNDYSYGVYIIACPVQQALLSAFPGLSPIALTALAIGIVVPLAALSWRFIERPAMQRRHGLAARIKAHWLRLDQLRQGFALKTRRSAPGMLSGKD